MQQPLVSIIVPNYNHARFLKQRIESILQQEYTNYELILLDDASTDGSREILLSYQKNPHVSAIALNETNTGNTFLQWEKGIQLAQGKYVWIAESDDAADSLFLKNTVAELEKHPDATMCLTGSILIDENNQPMVSVNRDKWKETGEIKVFNGLKYIEHNLLFRNYVYNASMVLFHRHAYSQVDKSFSKLRVGGDRLFWAGVAREGNVIEVRKKLNYFRQHSTKVTFRARKTGEELSNNLKATHYILSLIQISTYKRWLALGKCYRSIKRSQRPFDIQHKLYCEAKELGVKKIHYYVSRANRVLAVFFPFLPTIHGSKLK